MTWSPATGRMRHAAFGRPVHERRLAGTAHVDGVSGSAMLVRRDVFDACGFFDDEYFFGFEDLAFCLRASSRGFSTVCCPEAVVYHEGGMSMGRAAAKRVYFATRNHLKLASAERGSLLARLIREGAVMGFNLAYVLTSRDVRLVSGFHAFLRGVRHHLAGRYGPG
jgi:GT2 family glycosyltransferase